MNEVSNCLVQGFSTPALEVHFTAELGQPLSNTSKQAKQGVCPKAGSFGGSIPTYEGINAHPNPSYLHFLFAEMPSFDQFLKAE